jgi:hypothetical protein
MMVFDLHRHLMLQVLDLLDFFVLFTTCHELFWLLLFFLSHSSLQSYANVLVNCSYFVSIFFFNNRYIKIWELDCQPPRFEGLTPIFSGTLWGLFLEVQSWSKYGKLVQPPKRGLQIRLWPPHRQQWALYAVRDGSAAWLCIGLLTTNGFCVRPSASVGSNPLVKALSPALSQKTKALRVG